MEEETAVATQAPALDPQNETKILVQSSLVALTQTDYLAAIQAAAKSNPLKAILSEVGDTLWTPGTQQLVADDALELDQYILEFEDPVKFEEFYETITAGSFEPSFMHLRRPGDKVGIKVEYIVNREKAAAIAKLSAPKAILEKEPFEIKFQQFEGNILDPELKVLTTDIKKSPEGLFYATFGIVTKDGTYKFFRAESATEEGVEKKIGIFIRNPEI